MTAAPSRSDTKTGIATELEQVAARLLGGPLPVGLRVWDGSETGPADGGPVVVLRSPVALRHLLWRPGELGLARAYITARSTSTATCARACGAAGHTPATTVAHAARHRGSGRVWWR